MKFKFLFVALFTTLLGFAQKGTVTGVITDKDMNNEVLPFATVMIKGTTNGMNTDDNGSYSLSVSEGSHVLVISFLGYESVEVPFTIAANETKTINQALGSKGVEIEDVIIKIEQNREKETALLAEQKKAVEIKQAIGAQELSRKGISDVEEGLTKITGITKAESKGLFVRGLEDRYNNLLINDLQAPSNSPFKKIIPLDLFPTDIVGVLEVYKTFNPNIPGDFAGATINVETSEPKASQTKFSVGFGYVTNNNGGDFLISETANSTQGFFGIQKKYRELPSAYGSVGAYKLTSAEYKESYKDNSWNVDNVSAPINNSLSFSHTDKFNLKKGSFSYLLSLNGENKYQVRKGIERNFTEGLGEYNNDLYSQSFSYQTSTSALVALKYKSDRFQVATNSIYIRTTDNLIKDQFGVFSNQKINPNRLVRTNQFEQTDYFNNQLLLNYKLTSDDKHSLKGGISYVKTLYELPDRKFLDGNVNPDGTFQNSYGGNTLNRQHFNIKGNYYISGLLEYKLNFGKEVNNKTNNLTLGFNSYRNSITSNYRFFSTRALNGSYTVTTSLNDINEQILSDIESGLVFEREESTGDYKVKLNQFVNAGYGNVFFNLSEKMEINGGVRFETSDRTIKYRDISDSFTNPYRKITETKNYILPSVNTKYTLTDKANLRFAASQTITRPVLMEVLPVQFVNPDGTVERGNSSLEDTKNINVDLKYEFFTDKKDMIAIGLYGKNIQDPIERIFVPSATQITTFQNSKSANLYGAEAEFIFNMAHLSESLENFSVGVNGSFMKTEVDLTETNKQFEKRDSRELQGASNWVLNADAKYEFDLGKNVKNTVSLVYGVKGKNIYAVGTAGLDNIYELPFHKLDFVYTSKLTENISAKFSADNILNPYQRFELGDESKVQISESSLILKEYKKGVGLSLSLSYTF
ncbi:TonB-dependent receptor [Flavobacterium sp.]|uniref:TonB-dependent receptor n=1 Tax=Flavobacterium sp. TaxID=239 RepID=UPI0028BE11C7|nr:carboxypeptidase-like regulatory domain-containing protein [Flavobacterium sp.]